MDHIMALSIKITFRILIRAVEGYLLVQACGGGGGGGVIVVSGWERGLGRRSSGSRFVLYI